MPATGEDHLTWCFLHIGVIQNSKSIGVVYMKINMLLVYQYG